MRKAKIKYVENGEVKTCVVDNATEGADGFLEVYESDSKYARKSAIINMCTPSFIYVRWLESHDE